MTAHQRIRAELDRFRAAHPPPERKVSWQVQECLKCIHKDPFDPALNVKTVKVRCRISDNNVSCRFKHEMGITIKDYIQSLRFKAAARLLESGSWSISQVAQTVGYRHLQTFYAAFERSFECTPGHFRFRH